MVILALAFQPPQSQLSLDKIPAGNSFSQKPVQCQISCIHFYRKPTPQMLKGQELSECSPPCSFQKHLFASPPLAEWGRIFFNGDFKGDFCSQVYWSGGVSLGRTRGNWRRPARL